MVTFTKEQCLSVARRYLVLSRLFASYGDPAKAAGYLNSAHHWRRMWQHRQGRTA